MKTKLLPLILLLALLTLSPAAFASVWQTTFVQTPQRNQQGQQQGQQNQPGQGLSPDKKKSLSKYGPEDVFPGAHEQEDNNKQPNRQNTRRPSGAQSTPIPTPTMIPSPTQPPVQTPSPEQREALITSTPLPAPSAITTPAATTVANRLNQTPAGTATDSFLVPIFLIAASLLVLGALIYVLGMLKKKLREGR